MSLSTPSSDYFAALGQPRRPWLDPDALKEKFHRTTAEQHPDRAGDNGEFASVNAAYAILRDPGTRLRHLLELEHPEALGRTQQITEKLSSAFLRLATLRRTIDAFVKQQAAASTPLAQALLASERFTLQRDVEKELTSIETAHAECVAAVRSIDKEWAGRGRELAPRLAELQQELTYLAKWNWQLRESLFQLQTPATQ